MTSPDSAPSDLTSLHVRRAAQGDADSLRWIVERFDPLIEAQVRFRIGPGRGEEVRDVVEEVWLAALPRIGALQTRAGRSTPVLVKFLSTTALNKCNAWLQRRIRGLGRGVPASDSDPPLEEVPDDTRGVVTRASSGDVRALVADALARLDEARREVLVLRLVEQRPNAEVAEMLGISPNTAAQRYRRAAAELRRRLPSELAMELGLSA